MADFEPLEGTDLALALIEASELAKAEIFVDSLLRRAPEHPAARFLAGAVALKQGRQADAIEALAAAFRADPANTTYRDVLEQARVAYARRLTRNGRGAEARAQLDAADAARPDGIFAVMRAATWLETMPTTRAAMDHGRAAYDQAVRALAHLDLPIEFDRVIDAGTHFFAPYQGVNTRPWQEIIADFYRRNCPALSYRASHVGQAPGPIVRIGFVSGHFHNHTVAKLFRGIIQRLDRARFHVTALFAGERDDEYARAIKAESDRAVFLPTTLAAAHAAIAAERLDILFYTDIGMEPFTFFLAFARLARLQVMGWGHPVTSGLTSIDYFVSSDDLEVPGEAEEHYTEGLHRLSLPPTYLYPPAVASPADAPDLSFAHGRTIYCCPQSPFKIHPDFDDLALSILARDPNGILVMIEPEPGWAAPLVQRWRLEERRLADRVVFLPRLSQRAFLGLLAAAPVILDTIYFSGGISTVEALTQGSPVVTWPNTPLMCGRVSYAYYREMGVMDCVADSADDYVTRAVRLGTDAAYRAEISARIRANTHKLFRRAEVLRDLEAFLIEALDETKSGAPGRT